LGSWIAAGWAHVLGEDLGSAREVFERTLALDPTFSESHGSLGVVEFMEGNIDVAKSLASRALRLDRESFSGALLTSTLLSGAGKTEDGTRIFERALTTPIDATGRTLLDAMVRMGIRR
jgi:tetratricopeptide (TPR) repeat protein